ncbi:MAG: SET domain-containing protein [Acidiferrobacter sp.]
MIYVQDSAQHGRGVFVRVPVVAGTPLLAFCGPRLSRAQIDPDDYHLQIGADLYLGPSGEADDYVNHSCDPNAGFKADLILYALRDIATGEELTWDYSCAIDEADFAGFPCSCQSPRCRGLVRSFRHLDVATRERLRAHALPYLRDLYR